MTTPNRTCRECGLYCEGADVLRKLFRQHKQCLYGFNTICLDCDRKKSRAYFEGHVEYARSKSASQRAQRKALLQQILADAASKTKVCVDCGQSLPATKEYFDVQVTGRYGLLAHCRTCRRESQRGRITTEGQRAKRRAAYAEKYRARVLVAARERYRRLRQDSAEYTKLLAASRAYAKAHPEKRRDSARRWHVKHPEKRVEYKQRRRAREVGAPGHFTADDVARKLREQHGRCFYCGADDKGKLTVDHMTPLSRGGSNFASNIALACRSCNSTKIDKTVEEFLVYRNKCGT